jgi:hypothetical protein
MTVEQFRKMALALPDVEERAHMQHPDFRVRSKIFATLGYPDKEHGVLMLTPEQQNLYVRDTPEIFSPVRGAWGKAGSTLVSLNAANSEAVGDAMTAAWQNAVSKAAAKKRRSEGSRPPNS